MARDWRNALRTSSPVYRMGNSTVHFNCHYTLLVIAAFVFFIFIYNHVSNKYDKSIETSVLRDLPSLGSKQSAQLDYTYNTTYPITPPLLAKDGSITYRLGMVADLDQNSKFTNTDGSLVWRSYFKKGYLTYNALQQSITIKWDDGEPKILESAFSLKGRGMELSELVTFDGKLLTFDDRTGLVFVLVNDKAIPWVIMLDGMGRNSSKGFKAEWATVKDKTLIVGSMGKEWTSSSGQYQNDNPMFIKSIKTTGEVKSLNWAYPYRKLRSESQQINWPGYMIHESGVWSEYHKKWFFLPRRCSTARYNETEDEMKGCKVLISADADFNVIETKPLLYDKSPKSHGFSSFKFVPHTNDGIIVALKSEELLGKTSTYIYVFDVEGKTLVPEQRVDTDFKYEGIEFI